MVSEINHIAPLGSSDNHSNIVAILTGQRHNINLIMAKRTFLEILYLDEHPIRVDGDVDSMWESFKKFVIEVRDRHFLLKRIGARKWKSE